MKDSFVIKVAALSVLPVMTVALLASPAFAGGLVNTSDSPQIVAGQQVDGTAWLAGNNVSVAGTVQGDLFCAGNTVTITGVVEGDVLCAGSTVTVLGRVSGDVRLAGNSVTMSGSTDGAASLAGNSVTLSETATVGSDLTAGAATLNLAGSVGRDARLGAQSATLAGIIVRDVDAEVDHLTVTAPGAVGGHLHYVSPNDAAVEPGTVQGEVRRTDPPPRAMPTTPITRPPTVLGWLLGALASIAWFVVLSLAVVLLLPKFVRRVTDTTWEGAGKAALLGLVALAAIVPLVILLFVTLVGAGAAMLLVVGFPLALLLAGPLGAYYVGRQLMGRRTDNMVALMAVGAAVLGVAMVIPFLGFVAGLAIACLGLGFILLDLRHQFTTSGRSDMVPPVPPRYPMAPGASFTTAPTPGPNPPERTAPPPVPPPGGDGTV